MSHVDGLIGTILAKLRNAVIAGLCGMMAQSLLMAVRRWFGILPAFQPYLDLQNLLAKWVGAEWAQSLSWLLPMVSGALVWSSIFAWAYDRIPAATVLGKGLLVTAFAWLLTGLVFLPAIGHGVFAARAGAGAWPALLMLVMLAAYCLTLSLVYAWLRRGNAGASAS